MPSVWKPFADLKVRIEKAASQEKHETSPRFEPFTVPPGMKAAGAQP